MLHAILASEAEDARGKGVVLGKQTHPWEPFDFLMHRESSSTAPREMRPSLASPVWNETFPPC